MKVSTLALAALLSVSTTAVFAQQQIGATTTTPGSQMTEESAASENNGSQVGATGDVNGQNQDFNLFLRDFGKADFTSAQSGIGAATNFQIVKLSTLANADKALLDGAMAPHAGDMASLSTSLNANPAASQALQTEGFGPVDVVWAQVADNGLIRLYVDDLDAKNSPSGSDTNLNTENSGTVTTQ